MSFLVFFFFFLCFFFSIFYLFNLFTFLFFFSLFPLTFSFVFLLFLFLFSLPFSLFSSFFSFLFLFLFSLPFSLFSSFFSFLFLFLFSLPFSLSSSFFSFPLHFSPYFVFFPLKISFPNEYVGINKLVSITHISVDRLKVYIQTPSLLFVVRIIIKKFPKPTELVLSHRQNLHQYLSIALSALLNSDLGKPLDYN